MRMGLLFAGTSAYQQHAHRHRPLSHSRAPTFVSHLYLCLCLLSLSSRLRQPANGVQTFEAESGQHLVADVG